MQDGRRWWLVDDETADALRAARPPTALQRLRASAVVVAVTAPLVACNAKSGFPYPEQISEYPGTTPTTGTPAPTSTPSLTSTSTGGTGASTGGTGAQRPGTGN